MKQIFTALLICLIFATPGFSQQSATSPFDQPVTKFVVRDTIFLPGIPRDELYSRAWNWFESINQSNPAFMKEANKRLGRFTGTNHFTFNSKISGGSDYVKGKIYYSLQVYVDNEYFVYELSDFTHLARISFNIITTDYHYPYKLAANKEWHDRVWQEMKEQSRREAVAVLVRLKEGMAKKTDKYDYYMQLWSRDPANAKLDIR